MINLMKNVELVSTEIIPSFIFDSREVLSSLNDIEKRTRRLFRGMILGNMYNTVSEITFETSCGVKTVPAIIWAMTSSTIILKGGVFLPTRSVVGVSFNKE